MTNATDRRTARLAAALRANLTRRKAQMRGRAAQGSQDGARDGIADEADPRDRAEEASDVTGRAGVKSVRDQT